MKYIIAILSCVVFMGCYSNAKAVAPTEAPAVMPTKVTQRPHTVVPPTTEPEEQAQEFTADGTRAILKGDGWKVEVPVDVGWKRMQSNRYALAIMNPETSTLVLVDGEDWDKSLAEYVKYQKDLLKAAKGRVVSEKPVVVNQSKSVVMEFELSKGAKVWEWAFVNGNKAFSFSCGGPGDAYVTNKPICEDLINHFFLN